MRINKNSYKTIIITDLISHAPAAAAAAAAAAASAPLSAAASAPLSAAAAHETYLKYYNILFHSLSYSESECPSANKIKIKIKIDWFITCIIIM
jgi:hypothetical protein